MKYPHTSYFKFSPSVDKEDVRESGYFNINNFINKDIIFTTKMDGSNCVMTSKHIAARNGKTADHSSFDYAKVLHSQIHTLIPENHHVFGEWLYAKHNIWYDNLDDYYQVFAIYNEEKQTWLCWQDVIEIAGQLGLVTVEYSKIYNINDIKTLKDTIIDYAEQKITNGHEGIVVRTKEAFKDFDNNVAKYVRRNHVQTDEHWSKQKIIRNILKL